MPKFIDYNYDQMKMLAVSYDKQILPGTFESSLMYLIDEKLDLTIFHTRYKNDDNGLFQQVLLICDAEGLIGKELFAIDGCKLPSNASKEWSGTHDELKRKKAKIDKAVDSILEKHRHADTQACDESVITRELKQKDLNRDDLMSRSTGRARATKLDRASHKIGKFLKIHEDRTGVSGKVIKSNITDNGLQLLLHCRHTTHPCV